MASPVSDSYNVATGGTIRGGRYSQGAAPPVVAKYRYQWPQLFQTARSAVELSHLPGGTDYSNEGAGPNYWYINDSAGWAWDVPGGDWLDSTMVRHGSSAWFSVLANAVSGSTAVAEYTVACTTALQFIQSNARWNAFMMRCPTAPRALAGVFSTTHPKPVIEVTYVGGATAVLACKIVARITTGTAYPLITQTETALPLFIEFERPTAAVQSATMRFTITQHWSGSTPTIAFFVVDPPVNTDAVAQGIAASSGLFDSGLVSHPSIIGLHRYLDGTVIDSFNYAAGGSTSSESSYDPAIFNNGPTDLTKYPHAGLGKWIKAFPAWSIVDSTYTGEGFEPLAAGLGALRVPMSVPVGMADGYFPNYSMGTAGSSNKIFMPEPLFGNLDHIFVRHYMRIGTPNGQPYRMPIAKRYQMRQTEAGSLVWANCAGKMGITPVHETKDGANSASSGGGYGWQMRLGWSDCTSDESGPDVGGWRGIVHMYDYANNNPVGYRYGQSDTIKDMSLSQRGGLGTLYADKWYCIEMELKLNTVMVDAPGYVPDGELRVWIDGRLANERVGMVFRSLPLMDNSGPNPPYDPGTLRPCRQLGVTALWFNWYHGGTTQNTTDRTIFVTGLAYGTSYIGPMQLTGSQPSLPAWVPNTNTVGTIPEVNTFTSVYPGDSPVGGYSYNQAGTYFDSSMFPKIINDFSGGIYNPYYGTKGCMLFHGGGHSASNWNGIVAFDLATLTYSVVLGGSTVCYPADRTNGEYADGQAMAPHSYDMLAVLGPEAGYPLGALFTPVCMASSYESGDSNAAHIFDFANPSLKWVRKSINTTSVGKTPGGACAYDPDLGRVWWVFNSNQSGYQPYFNLATNLHAKVTISLASSLSAPNPDSQCLRYDSARKLLICIDVNSGGSTRRVWYFNTLNPSAGWTRATLSVEFPSAAGGLGFAFDRQPDGKYICYSRAVNTKLYRMTIPDNVTAAWTIEEITYAGTTLGTAYVLGKRWSYIPALQSFVCKFNAASAHQIYRP